MEKNQRIYCNVNSCKFNDKNKEVCELEEIRVCACLGCNTSKAKEESMCDSYVSKYINNQ